MAEAMSIIGLCATVISTIVDLNTLLSKYRGAESAVSSLAVQAETIAAGVSEMKDRLKSKSSE